MSKPDLQGALVTAAGAPSKPARADRRQLAREAARLLRAAKDDDEAGLAIEAVIELARTAED